MSSIAQKHAERMKAAKQKAAEGQAEEKLAVKESPRFTLKTVYNNDKVCSVGEAGGLLLQDASIQASEAVRLALWILQTFTEVEP